jgi:type I restriction enzyme M protein
MQDIEKLENDLWEAADQLRANSKLTSTEYSIPVLGLIFLRHAFNRFVVVEKEVKKTLPQRGGRTRPLIKDDFIRKSALFLRKESQFDYLLELPQDKDLGQSIMQAMELIEKDHESLSGVLPREYHIFDNDLLSRLLKIFNNEALKTAGGDVFGRIYEYFLMKFAMQGAQDSGEFFTPLSLVQTIVNVIEPDHGTVFDPACGSGGMFVQTSHFLENRGTHTHQMVTFYGQEKTSTTIRLAKMNLAVHGLEGKIVEGNTFYEDLHGLYDRCDFVMANPPFNVDGVDAKKVETDPRLPFGLPGVNKKGDVSNGNYLWISYFYSYLNDTGRAGFVMSSQASSAGHGEKEVRRKIIQTGHVEIMISIRSNFFYTRSVPCELWFFNKNKPPHLQDKVLMFDARTIYRKLTRKIYDFTPEQLKNLTAIVWLYRGETEKFLTLVHDYLKRLNQESSLIREKLTDFDNAFTQLQALLNDFLVHVEKNSSFTEPKRTLYKDSFKDLEKTFSLYQKDRDEVCKTVDLWITTHCNPPAQTNETQHTSCQAFDPLTDKLKAFIKNIDALFKAALHSVDTADNELKARKSEVWNYRAAGKLKKELDILRKKAVDQIKQARYFHKNIHWLHKRFPSGEFTDVEGLVKLVHLDEIEANDWSLTPGRYVGVAPIEEDEDFDFEAEMREIHRELGELNEEAERLAKVIMGNFEEVVG